MDIFDKWASQIVDGDHPVSLSNIHDDARQYFQDLCSANTDANTSSTSTSTKIDESVDGQSTQKSISSNLALLISKMGEALSSNTNTPKLKALHYLLGATDGLQIGNQNVGLPLKMAELMSRFYMEHCSPMQSTEISIINSSDGANLNESVEDYTVEDVRDTALTCISSLLQSPIIDDKEATSKDGLIQLRISIMKEAVQKRCASIEDEEDEDYMDDDSHGEGDASSSHGESRILSGLSLLPRAKRSLCFEALEATLKGIANDIEYHAIQELPLESKSTEMCISFTSFASACLHGESDPRCLVQMLTLLKRIQSVLLPFCFNKAFQSDNNNSQVQKFPFLAIFDAVAPYYPIKFTPPPNDPWGITRESLHDALFDVLTYSTHHSDEFQTLCDDDNMTVSATRLMLERLSPPSAHPYDDDQDELTTVQDRIDAMEDLSALLLLPLDQGTSMDQSNWVSKSSQKQSCMLSNLSNEVAQEMSNTLLLCHEDAASSVISATNKEEENDNKKLATLCRNFACRISYEFEIHLQSQEQAPTNPGSTNSNKKKTLWDCFVLHRVRDLSNIISSSPQSIKGRVAIAYVASLSACGGERTLRLCLDTCIPPLLGILKQSDRPNGDEEQISTAAYGLGVFFSSARLSMEQITKDGIEVHPHPLQVFGTPVIQLLCKITNRSDTNVQLKIATVKALESVLVSSPFEIMDKVDAELVRQTVFYLAQCLIDDMNIESSGDQMTSDWKLACARLVGTTIGRATKKSQIESQIEENKKMTLFEEDAEISTFVETTLFPKILTTCTEYCDDEEDIRYGWKVLAYACEVGEKHVSDSIMSQLFEALKRTIQIDEHDEKHVQHITFAISHILQQGGSNPRIAFHTNDLQIDLINTLSRPRSRKDQRDAQMSTLLLPEIINKKRTEAENAIQLALSVLPHLLMAYYNATPQDKLETILSFTTQVLPPLSDWDNARLCVVLPVLSIILAGDFDADEKVLCSLVPPLVEYILTKDNNQSARTAAGSCIFYIVSKKFKDQDNCVGQNILRDTICPLVVNKVQGTEDDSLCSEELDELQDAINLIALIGSATACLGGSSSKISDEVTRFLTIMACEGTVHSAILGVTNPLYFKGNSGSNNSKISIIAGNALGFMLSVENRSPFWRQRTSHLVLPIILSSFDICVDIEHGRLLCACHLVCNVSVQALGEKRLLDLTTLIVNGLEKCVIASLHTSDDDNTETLRNSKTILTTSLMKIMNDSQQSTTCHLRTILPIVVLILISSDDVREVPTNLIALQILTNIATGQQSANDETTSFCQSYKETVVMHLAQLLDHPSFQIRQAAAHTRNNWFVMNHL